MPVDPGGDLDSTPPICAATIRLLYYYDQRFTGCHPSPLVFTGSSVHRSSVTVTGSKLFTPPISPVAPAHAANFQVDLPEAPQLTELANKYPRIKEVQNAGLRNLRTTNPTLHAALTETVVTELPVFDVTEEEAYTNRVVNDDCDVPLDVVASYLVSNGSSVTTNFAVGDNGGITRSGNAEASDAEEEEEDHEPVDAAPAVLGRDQRKKIPTSRYGAQLGRSIDFLV
ncbi:hypothetical protein K438DRAFT_1779006 [Mycena galopus ATCC 62051]|nr:hypothetical protein K438DRAFT_1779006 [Mycena galopus ATCC 62051]